MHRILSTIVLPILFAATASATDCSKLTPRVCLDSVKCTLDCRRDERDRQRCASASYFCRREEGRCEMATQQARLTRQECEANPGCRFVSSPCFCQCDFDQSCDCECRGGRPPNCVEK